MGVRWVCTLQAYLTHWLLTVRGEATRLHCTLLVGHCGGHKCQWGSSRGEHRSKQRSTYLPRSLSMVAKYRTASKPNYLQFPSFFPFSSLFPFISLPTCLHCLFSSAFHIPASQFCKTHSGRFYRWMLVSVAVRYVKQNANYQINGQCFLCMSRPGGSTGLALRCGVGFRLVGMHACRKPVTLSVSRCNSTYICNLSLCNRHDSAPELLPEHELQYVCTPKHGMRSPDAGYLVTVLV